MAKADRVYFENLAAAAEWTYKAASYLVVCLSDFHPENIKQMLDTMHEYENSGDEKKHEMSSMLAKAFVTPIEREDLALISSYIDDVTDSIEEILQGLYMYKLTSIPAEAIIFAEKIVECSRLLKQLLGEFSNFKKSEKLSNIVIEMNHIEEECDKLYIESTMHLDEHFDNVLDIISWRKIYDRMENCADSCEHVGDSIETIIMKNS